MTYQKAYVKSKMKNHALNLGLEMVAVGLGVALLHKVSGGRLIINIGILMLIVGLMAANVRSLLRWRKVWSTAINHPCPRKE